MLNGMPDIPDFRGLVTAIQGPLVSFGGAALLKSTFGVKNWGIVNEFGIPIVLADSVLGLSYDAGNTISNLPIEQGSFASYNKVNAPSIATVQLAKSSGGDLQRGLFLAQIETLMKSTLKFNVISPEYIYLGYSIIGMSYVREQSDGATLIKVNVELQEVREAKIEYSYEEVKQPSDAEPKDGGAKQASDQSSNSVLFDIFGALSK